jgi:hypothetical protein
MIDLFPILNDRIGLSPDYPHHPTATWILNNTPPRSRFLTTTYFYHPASLAGRYLFLDYGYFNWSLGYDEAKRRHFVRALFDQTLTHATACRQLAYYGLDYLLLSPGKGEVSTLDPHDLPLLQQSTPIYSSLDGYTIYSVKALCP